MNYAIPTIITIIVELIFLKILIGDNKDEYKAAVKIMIPGVIVFGFIFYYLLSY